MPSGQHRGTRAIQTLVEYAPSTGGLALWMRHADVDGPQAPVLAANDGKTIFYGPDFEQLSPEIQVGVVAHQVLHVALCHVARRTALSRVLGEVDAQLYNHCADAIVNSTLDHLAWLELPPGAIRLDSLLNGLLEPSSNEPVAAEAALLAWDVERLYRAVDDRQRRNDSGRWRAGNRSGRGRNKSEQQSAGEGSATQPGGQGHSDREDQSSQAAGSASTHATTAEKSAAGQARAETATTLQPRMQDGPRSARLRSLGRDTPPDLMPDPGADTPEQQAELAREWRERLTRAHANDGAYSLLRTLIADLPTQRIPWEQLLRTQLARGLSHQPDLSWSRPARSYLASQGRIGARRLPWEPGTSASRAVARLVVMVDLSGSIEESLLGRFATEIEAISRRLASGLVVIAGDDRVQGVEHFEPGRSNLRELAFMGGGGTDFTPMLLEAERHAPDIAVFLTDLDGPARHKPRFPVLWAVPANEAHRPVPFGRLLTLE